jgi:deoxyadenosine/deoxycytidine kinase
MNYHFITIEGNIGAGKTTLAHLLARHFNARLVLEAFADNPFLPKFYESPQIQQKDLFQNITVSDYLFTKCLLFAKVNLPADEFRLYQRLFEIIHQQLLEPDILIYLHAPVQKLQQNIKKRARSYEQNIPDAYLQNIQETYTHYLKQHDRITLFVDAGQADFLGNEAHLQTIIAALDSAYQKGVHYLTLP